MIPRLLERAARASRLACNTFGSLHSPPPPNTASSNGNGSGGGLDMDVDESDAAGGGSGSGSGGGGKAARGPDAGAATAEGVELLQVPLQQQQQQLDCPSSSAPSLFCLVRAAAAAGRKDYYCLASTSHRLFFVCVSLLLGRCLRFPSDSIALLVGIPAYAIRYTPVLKRPLCNAMVPVKGRSRRMPCQIAWCRWHTHVVSNC